MASNNIIGWEVDHSDRADGQTGTNTFIKRLTAFEAKRVAGDELNQTEWLFLVNQLHTFMVTSTPLEFLDGPSGDFFAKVCIALGADPSTIPTAP